MMDSHANIYKVHCIFLHIYSHMAIVSDISVGTLLAQIDDKQCQLYDRMGKFCSQKTDKHHTPKIRFR